LASGGTPDGTGLNVVISTVLTNIHGLGIDFNAMVLAEEEKLPAEPRYEPIVVAPVVVESNQNATVNKYRVDNNVVAVTYAETTNSPYYKTLLLNFNDYTIRTEYNGVTYTIAAYDYVVIKY
jgi:hypothetical protein